ncbi:hypothetical protein EST38_g4582 [Candolleomyces aberdarensis]|uniref:Uncharacterized protein n=1 Tax=Candolleomyces aberdarensis TaxID=2316362 RepID=A0A4Q2DML7_9AGAR|nr:hypothetical protein EST38_g4582 [Candolleomyces aberdarensis]
MSSWNLGVPDVTFGQVERGGQLFSGFRNIDRPEADGHRSAATHNNPSTSSPAVTAPNSEDHGRILEKMGSLASHCQNYIELAYSTHLNALNIQAYDDRIGTVLLALHGLVAQRRICSEQHQGYAAQMAATLRHVEGMGFLGEATNLRDAVTNIEDAVRAVWGADPTTISATQVYQELLDPNGQPVMVIPLVNHSRAS